MTAGELAENLAAEEDCGEFPHVLDGVVLIGAARVWRGCSTAGSWTRRGGSADQGAVIAGGHRLLGRTMCRVEGCQTTVHSGLTVVCHRCFSRLTRLGMSKAEIAATA